MKKLFYTLFIFLTGQAAAQNPNWAEDIAPILFNHCTPCHHTGGLAPFPLITFGDAAAVQLGMQDAVTNRRMPPWPPDPAYVPLAHERLLSAAEITAIDDWVNNGAPSGNLSLAPPPPVYNNGSLLGVADLSLTIPTYTITSPTDIYRCFPMASNLAAQQFITAMEVIPGNPAIVHHVLVYADVGNNTILLDSADPGPGYTNFGGSGSGTAKLIGAWVPGAMPYSLPVNMGISLQANTNIIVQIHYPAGSLGMTDTTKVNFKLSPGPLRDVTIFPVLNHAFTMTNGPLYIPADSIRTFHEQYLVAASSTISVLSVAPHMHLIGKNIISYGVTPVNDTIPFIKIDNWDFKWQGNYSFRKVLKVPGGTTLHAYALYDNTSNNLLNPNIPPQDVWDGESTTDEMMLIYFFFLAYQPGDENIIIDSTVVAGITGPDFGSVIVTPQLYDVYPNPSAESINISFFLPAEEKVSILLTDISGKISGEITDDLYRQGIHELTYDISRLPAGSYQLTLRSGSTMRSKTFVKN